MRKEAKYLVLILIAAFILRLMGLSKASFYIDEATMLWRGRLLMPGGEIFDPRIFDFTVTYAFLLSLIHSVFMYVRYFWGGLFQSWKMTDISVFYFDLKIAVRFFSVIIGTSTVLVVYLTAKKLFNSCKIGLLSALVLAISLNHVFQSRYALVDIPIGFLTSLVLLFSVKAAREKKHAARSAFISGVVAAMAVSLKYQNAYVLIIFPFCMLLLSNLKILRMRGLIKAAIFHFAGGILGFLISNPFFVINPSFFINELMGISTRSIGFAFGNNYIDNVSNIAWYLSYWARSGLYYPFFALFIVGILFGLKKHLKESLLLLIYPVIQFSALWTYAGRTDRHTVWFAAPVSIFIGLSIFYVYRAIKGGRWKYALVLLISIVAVRTISMCFSIALRPDTRQEAATFLASLHRPIYFVNDIDGRYMNVANIVSLSSHEERQAVFDSQSTLPMNIYRYPNELAALSSFIYEEAVYIAKRNPDNVIFESAPTLVEPERQKTLKVLTEHQSLAAFMNTATRIREFSSFWFGGGVFNSVRQIGGGTDVGVSYNPTVKIYRIPKIDNVPPIAVGYYPREFSRFSLASIDFIGGVKLIDDSRSSYGKTMSIQAVDSNKPAVITTSRSPFPVGKYIISLRLMPLFKPLPWVKYGILYFGDSKIKGNISIGEIWGRDIQNLSGYSDISVVFKLSQITSTGIEFYWYDSSPVLLESIILKQII